MLTYQTHVFLGPSLDVLTARKYLWDAYYHPPIQCGDIIRLLRLPLKKIIIIDGLYEQVPAVWHKEILLALDKGLAVYGAASMGALRAAELYPYGMIGIGSVFEAFRSHQLNDDDEVAVLHQGMEQQLIPINDAMVNIRQTLEYVYQQQIIDEDTKHALINCCKAQFYPQRSLKKALEQIGAEYKNKCTGLGQWLAQNGLIDVKRQDTIAVLTHVQQLLVQSKAEKKLGIETFNFEMPYTKFLASMVDEVGGTPFPYLPSWLPQTETKLALLANEKPADYQLVHELSRLLQNAMNVVDLDGVVDEEHYLKYIAHNALYYPTELYAFLNKHSYLSPLTTWMLHYTCLSQITQQQMNAYLPAIAFYFTYEPTCPNSLQRQLFSWILFFVVLLNHQLHDPNLMIKKSVLTEHLQEIGFWRRYMQYKNQCAALNSPNLLEDVKVSLDFILMYMKVIYIHHGVKDFKLGLAQIPTYYHWIYDAIALYEEQQEMLKGLEMSYE
jgi:hypothetical protein